MRIIYFVDNKLGGVSSLNYNLVNYVPEAEVEQWIIHIDLQEMEMTRANMTYPAQKNISFHYSSTENLYNTLKRLRGLIPDERGALVVNYNLEMQMLDHFPVKQTVYQLVHDEYNLDLAKKYGHVVDVFIAHNKFIFDNLVALMPQRGNDIFYLPHGVPIPACHREVEVNISTIPLKLLFLGRMDPKKGIYDLPVISNYLRDKGIPFEWTCIGSGPELEGLKKAWGSIDKVSFLSPHTNDEVLKIASNHDIFVLPTKFEGSPVSLLETMSIGLVPVITDLPGGIREIVDEQIGFRIELNNNEEFASAISQLHNDRPLLKKLSIKCREKIKDNYDVRQTAASYHDLFLQYSTFFSIKKIERRKAGARLDQPWLPGFITKSLRSLLR